MCVSPLARAAKSAAEPAARHYASFPDEVSTEAASAAELDTAALLAQDLLKSLQKQSAPKRPRMPKAVVTPVAEAALEAVAAPESTPAPLDTQEQILASAALDSQPEVSAQPDASAGVAKAAEPSLSETIYGGPKSPFHRRKKSQSAAQESTEAPEPVNAASAPAVEPAPPPAPKLTDTIYGGPESPHSRKSKLAAAIALASEPMAQAAPPAPLESEPIGASAEGHVHEISFAAEEAAPAKEETILASATFPSASAIDSLETELAADLAPEEEHIEVRTEAIEPEPVAVAVGSESESVMAAAATRSDAPSAAAAPTPAPMAAVFTEPAKPEPPPAASSTNFGRAAAPAISSEEWRRELSNRVEAYRARYGGGVAEEESAADLLFETAPEPEPQPEVVEEAVLEEPSPRASLRTAARRRPEPVEILAVQPGFDFSSALPAEAEVERPHSSLVPVADLGERRAAGLLDAAFLAASYLAFLVYFSSLGGKISFGKMEIAIFGVTAFLFYVQYYALFTIFGGATPGMMIRKLRAVSFDGSSPDAEQLMRRSFGYVVSAASLLLGFLWSLWDEDHLTWHDRMSHTYITQAPPDQA